MPESKQCGYLSKPDDIDCPQQKDECGYASTKKPECLIPRGQDLDTKPCARDSPRTADCCALHFKRVGTCRQRGVADDALIACCFVPVVVEPIQLVTVTIRFRIEKAQG